MNSIQKEQKYEKDDYYGCRQGRSRTYSKNLEDISQTITGGFFNMMMITDMNAASKPIGDISDELAQIGEEIGVVIKCQREEIFDSMHRI